MKKQKKILLTNVIIVAVLLIIASILRSVLREMPTLFPPTLLTIIRATIHISIAVVWTESLRRRIVNKQVRNLLVLVGSLMVLWLLTKTVKYEFFPNNTTTVARYLWYSYYIPMVLIPLFGIIITQFIGKPDTYRLPKWTYCFYIPAFLLIIGVLTNDLHNFAFSFPKGIENFNSNYDYGFLYWCAMAWYIGLGVAFVTMLLRKSRLPGNKKMQILPLLIMIGAIAFWLAYTFKLVNGDLTVIDCLLIGTLLETAIQSGLIPTNSNYRALFETTSVPVIIVDENYQARYTSGGAIPVDEKAMRESVNGTVTLGNTLLSSTKIRAGRVLWQDDVTELNKQREELDEVREMLSEEFVLITAETEIKEKQAQADEKNSLYDKIAREVKPQLVILSKLLNKVEQGENVKENLARVAVIGSYVKRRGNLLLLGNENGNIPLREMENALRESLDNLKLLGVETSLLVSGKGDVSLDYAIKAYDLYERVIEATLNNTTAIFTRVILGDNKLKLSLQLGVTEGVSENALMGISADGKLDIEIEDSDVYVDLILGGDGK